MQALLEVEHLHSILPPCRLKDNEHYTPNLISIAGILPQETMDLMDSHDEAVLNTIDEKTPPLHLLGSLCYKHTSTTDEALIPIVFHDDDDDEAYRNFGSHRRLS